MVTTIGTLANVPDPGAPVASAWAQDATRLGIHRFATYAALAGATWPGLANGMMAVTLDTGNLWIREAGGWRLAVRPWILAATATKATTLGSLVTLTLAGVQTLYSYLATGTGGFSHVVTGFGAGSGAAQVQWKVFNSTTGAGLADGTNISFAYVIACLPAIGSIPTVT